MNETEITRNGILVSAEQAATVDQFGLLHVRCECSDPDDTRVFADHPTTNDLWVIYTDGTFDYLP